MHCGMPWGEGNSSPRPVAYTRGSAIFVVCVWCWPRVGGEQLLRYVAKLVHDDWPAAGVPLDYCVTRWPAIRDAHLDAKSAPASRGPRPELVAALDEVVFEHEAAYHPGRTCRENQFGACQDRFGDESPWS